MNSTSIHFIYYFQAIIKVLRQAFSSLFILPLVIFVSCSQSIKVDKSELETNKKDGLILHEGKLFTGESFLNYHNGQEAEIIQYKKGVRHGEYIKWFPDGTKSYEAKYRKGILVDKSFSWWKNGNLRSEISYKNGTVHGTHKQWYKSGQLFKEMNLVNGKEEGMQRAWRKNGKIYNNYEAKNGRIYGLKRANLCYELADEEVVL